MSLSREAKLRDKLSAKWQENRERSLSMPLHILPARFEGDAVLYSVVRIKCTHQCSLQGSVKCHYYSSLSK